MPTTDNMRKTIVKTNFSITFTTAFPGVTFYTATLVSTATSGTFTGMVLHVTGSGIGGSVDGLRVEAHSAAATTGIFWLNGAKIVAECDSASYVQVWMMGLYLQIVGASDSVIANAVGLYLDNNIKAAVTNLHTFIYLRNNQSGIPPDSYLTLYGGADYFIRMDTMTQLGACSKTGDATGVASGALKIDYYGDDRYIQLYLGPLA